MGQAPMRSLDDSLLDAYRSAAERNGRSLEAELRDALARLRPRTPEEIETRIARAHAIAAMTPSLPQTPSEILVREDRDR